jgi:hypothetical protein
MFGQFFQSEIDLVKDVAHKMERYTEAFQSGEMSRSEYEELCDDLLDLEKIEQSADALEQKIMISQAFKTMMAIAKALPI